MTSRQTQQEPPQDMAEPSYGLASLVVVTETVERPVATGLLAAARLSVHEVPATPFRAAARLISAIDPDLIIVEASGVPTRDLVEDVLAVARVAVVLVSDLAPEAGVELVDQGFDDVVPRSDLHAAQLLAAARQAVARRRRLLPAGESMATAEDAQVARLLSMLPEPVAVADAAGMLISVNPTARELLGCGGTGAAEARTLAEWLRVPESTGEDSSSTLSRARVLISGEWREIGVSRRRLRRDRFLIVFTDLDELTRVERELAESEARQQTVFMSSPAASLVADEGQVLAANPAASALVGAPAGELDHPALVALAREASGAGAGPTDVGVLVEGVGERWVQVTTVPVRFAGRDARLIFALDLSERRRLEEQVLAGGRLDAVGRLAGGIAHDFNNLLQVVNGHVERLREDLPAAEPLRQSVESIGAAAARATSLTEQLLAVGRRQVLLPRSVDLHDLVGRFMAEHAARIPEWVRVRLETDPHLPPVRIDSTRLSQALAHLISNACEAMPQGGELTISTRLVQVTGTERRLAAEGSVVEAGTYVSLDVKDTGRGMTPSVMAQAFEPFFTTKQNALGAGLGLSTVYGIIKQSGGYVGGESAPNRGTTWSLWLPGAGAPAAITPRPAPVSSRLRVLLVEDEEAVRTMLTEWLERDGLEVCAVGSAEEALTEQGRRTIDILVTDVGLPVVSGPDLARAMLQRLPGLPVIFISGFVADSIDRSEFDSQAVFLQKPFSPRDLARRIREVAAGVATST